MFLPRWGPPTAANGMCGMSVCVYERAHTLYKQVDVHVAHTLKGYFCPFGLLKTGRCCAVNIVTMEMSH